MSRWLDICGCVPSLLEISLQAITVSRISELCLIFCGRFLILQWSRVDSGKGAVIWDSREKLEYLEACVIQSSPTLKRLARL